METCQVSLGTMSSRKTNMDLQVSVVGSVNLKALSEITLEAVLIIDNFCNY